MRNLKPATIAFIAFMVLIILALFVQQNAKANFDSRKKITYTCSNYLVPNYKITVSGYLATGKALVTIAYKDKVKKSPAEMQLYSPPNEAKTFHRFGFDMKKDGNYMFLISVNTGTREATIFCFPKLGQRRGDPIFYMNCSTYF